MHRRMTSASAIPAAMLAPRLMTLRRCNRNNPAPTATIITAVNFCHSLGCSFNLSFIRSIGDRLEAARNFLEWLRSALQKKVADYQVIHLRIDKAAIGVVRRADNRLAPHVERC